MISSRHRGLGSGVVLGGVERAEEAEGSGAEAGWFGVVDDELLARGVADVEGLVGEVEGSGFGVVQVLGVPAFASDVVGLPQAAEFCAVPGEFGDEAV